MNPSDLINGLFELIGGILLARNCVVLYRDKKIRGCTLSATSFYMAWGYWNLFFYPHNGLWLSFIGGIVVVTANTVWVALAIRYRKN